MSDELDDAAFERAYQRMMFRRNQEALKREAEGGWDVNTVARREDDEPGVVVPYPFAFVKPEEVVGGE